MKEIKTANYKKLAREFRRDIEEQEEGDEQSSCCECGKPCPKGESYCSESCAFADV